MSRLVPQEEHRITIRGDVDGVAFRLWLQNVAQSLLLTGTARRVGDGVCEAIVQGPRFCIRNFVSTCKRGPKGVHVALVEDEQVPIERRWFEFIVVR